MGLLRRVPLVCPGEPAANHHLPPRTRVTTAPERRWHRRDVHRTHGRRAVLLSAARAAAHLFFSSSCFVKCGELRRACWRLRALCCSEWLRRRQTSRARVREARPRVACSAHWQCCGTQQSSWRTQLGRHARRARSEPVCRRGHRAPAGTWAGTRRLALQRLVRRALTSSSPAQVSDSEERLQRTFYSPAHRRAAELLAAWMVRQRPRALACGSTPRTLAHRHRAHVLALAQADAGLRVWHDAVGNVHGRIEVTVRFSRTATRAPA